MRGSAWMDHGWSTSALSEGVVGWDWFSIQLDDDRELMLFQLRLGDGGVAEASSGSLIGPGGEVTGLGRDDFEVEVLRRWTSPAAGKEYPARSRLRVPAAGLELEPLVADQEMDTALRYWEGAVRVAGEGSDGPARGFGYVELTGYGGLASLAGRAR